MLFGIEEAGDERIAGWIRPDRADTKTFVLVVLDSLRRHVLPMEAIPPPVTGETDGPPAGARRFVVDRHACAGWESTGTVELYESDTHLLVFRLRRKGPPGAPFRHVHLEPQNFPAVDLASILSPYVAMSYGAAELMDEDTLIGVLGVDHCRSLLVCGDLAYRPYAAYLRAETCTRSVLLGKPLNGLAGALLRAQMLGREGGDRESWKHSGQRTLNTAMREVDLADPAAIAAALDALPDRCRTTLTDPLTRRLATNGPDDRLREDHVEMALQSLAEFDVVGFDDDLDTFCRAIGTLAGVADLRPIPSPRPDGLAMVAAALSACEPARDFVRFDLLVYDLAHAAAMEAA